MPSQEQIDQEAGGSDLEQRVRTLEDTIATLRRNLLEATMTRPGTMRITPSLYLSPNGMIAKRFQGQYNLEVISNQIVGGSGAVPTGNDDMDYVKDGTVNILDASFLAANLYPPQGVGMLWVDRDYSLSTEPRPGSSPIPQSYLFGITSNAPNAYMTHSTFARLGSLSDGGASFVQTHSAKTTALTQADVGVKGAVWQKGVTLSQITSDQNDYEIGQNATTVFRISSDAARNITGIVAPTFDSTASNVPSAWWCVLYNVGSFNITLKDNSGSSSAGNKFALDADIVIKPDQGVFLMYDSASTVWRALAYPVTATGVATDTIWNAAGDLAVGTGADTATVLSGSSEDSYYLRYSTAINSPVWYPWLKVSNQTGDFSASGGFFYRVSGTTTVTMPLANIDGRVMRIINVGSGNVTVNRTSSDTFFYGTTGLTSHTILPGECFTYTAYAGGNEWLVS